MSDNREEERSDFTGRLSRRVTARVVRQPSSSSLSGVPAPSTCTAWSCDVCNPVTLPGLFNVPGVLFTVFQILVAPSPGLISIGSTISRLLPPPVRSTKWTIKEKSLTDFPHRASGLFFRHCFSLARPGSQGQQLSEPRGTLCSVGKFSPIHASRLWVGTVGP